MPLYEYLCESCGQRSEVLQRLGDPPLETCAECGGRLRKLVSSPAFQFKGSGWYVTDYARGSGAGDKAQATERAKSESGASAEGSDSASKSEAKPTGEKKDSPAPTNEGAAKPSAATPAPSSSGSAKE